MHVKQGWIGVWNGYVVTRWDFEPTKLQLRDDVLKTGGEVIEFDLSSEKIQSLSVSNQILNDCLTPFSYGWPMIISLSFQFVIKPYYGLFSSVAQSCPTLCNPMNRGTPGLPVHHQLLEFTQTHVYRVSDAIQPSHPLSSPSPPAPNPSQHQSLFQWVTSSHEVAKVLEFQL